MFLMFLIYPICLNMSMLIFTVLWIILTNMMVKSTALVIIICAFFSCASSDNAVKPISKATHLISVQEGGSLVFIGVSGPQLKPEQEVEAAREDAARKVSMYHGLSASFTSEQGSGSNALEYFVSSDFKMEYETQLDRYIGGLTHNPDSDVTRSDNETYVRFSYPGIYPIGIKYSSAKDSDGNPEWIKHPPQETNGFIIQVGYARRQQRLRDTIAKASEDAIANLISQSSSSINTKISSRNDISASAVTQKSNGKLLYFMVLETWINREDLSVWVLTVAKSAN